MRFGFEPLQDFIAAAFVKVGMPNADAATVAALMAQADLQGSDGHGVIRLPMYVRRIKAGGLNLRPNIGVVHEKPGMAVVAGGNAIGALVAGRAAAVAIAKAKKSRPAWVRARADNHAGPGSPCARRPP